MKHSRCKLLVILGLAFLSLKVESMTRVQAALGKADDIVFTNSPTNLYKFHSSGDGISFDKILLLRNASHHLSHEINLIDAHVRVFDKEHKIECRGRDDGKRAINLKPRAYYNIKCSIHLTSAVDIRLKSEDTVAVLRIPVTDSRAIEINLRLRLEDFN